MGRTKKQNKNQELRHHLVGTLGLGVLIFILALSALIFGFQKVYAARFLPGTYIGGINFGGQRRDDVAKVLEAKLAQLNRNGLNLVFEGVAFNPRLDELGIAYPAEDILERAFALGRAGGLKDRLGETVDVLIEGRSFALIPTVDQAKLEVYLKNVTSALARGAKDASFSYADGKLSVVPEELGLSVNLEKTKEAIQLYLNLAPPRAPLEVTLERQAPRVTAADLASPSEELERLLAAPIIVSAGGVSYRLEPTEVFSWLKLDSSGTTVALVLEQSKLQASIAALAKKIDRRTVDRQVSSSDGTELAPGRDGQALNQTDLLNQLSNALVRLRQGEEGVSRTLAAVVDPKPQGERLVDPPFTAGLYDGKYAEINLAEQKMYGFEGGTLVFTYTVSTGKWSTPTPTGTHYIESKTGRAYSKRYGLYMPYWNAITSDGAYGIHELPEWPGGRKEGENHLGTPVSHGCIRLGVGAAEQFYNWADVGTPIVIH